MKNIKATGEQITENRAELAQKYFGGLDSVYGKGNLGIVALLSDVQELIAQSGGQQAEHYRQILNDIKCILISDDRAGEAKAEPEPKPEPEIVTLKPVKPKVGVDEEKVKQFCEVLTAQGQARLRASKLDCEPNLKNAEAHYHIAKKYTRVDTGSSGRFMVVNETGEIYGIKAYGVIHKGHQYGTLDTLNGWDWGNYYPVKKGE